MEQSVALDNSDDIYNWPTMYAVEVGHWQFNPEKPRSFAIFWIAGAS